MSGPTWYEVERNGSIEVAPTREIAKNLAELVGGTAFECVGKTRTPIA